MVDPLIALRAGDMVGAAIDVFTTVLGNFAFVIGFIAIIGAVYLKTQDVTIPTIMAMMLGIAMTALLPPEGNVGYLILILAVVTIFAKAFKIV